MSGGKSPISTPLPGAIPGAAPVGTSVPSFFFQQLAKTFVEHTLGTYIAKYQDYFPPEAIEDNFRRAHNQKIILDLMRDLDKMGPVAKQRFTQAVEQQLSKAPERKEQMLQWSKDKFNYRSLVHGILSVRFHSFVDGKHLKQAINWYEGKQVHQVGRLDSFLAGVGGLEENARLFQDPKGLLGVTGLALAARRFPLVRLILGVNALGQVDQGLSQAATAKTKEQTDRAYEKTGRGAISLLSFAGTGPSKLSPVKIQTPQGTSAASGKIPIEDRTGQGDITAPRSRVRQDHFGRAAESSASSSTSTPSPGGQGFFVSGGSGRGSGSNSGGLQSFSEATPSIYIQSTARPIPSTSAESGAKIVYLASPQVVATPTRSTSTRAASQTISEPQSYPGTGGAPQGMPGRPGEVVTLPGAATTVYVDPGIGPAFQGDSRLSTDHRMSMDGGFRSTVTLGKGKRDIIFPTHLKPTNARWDDTYPARQLRDIRKIVVDSADSNQIKEFDAAAKLMEQLYKSITDEGVRQSITKSINDLETEVVILMEKYRNMSGITSEILESAANMMEQVIVEANNHLMFNGKPEIVITQTIENLIVPQGVKLDDGVENDARKKDDLFNVLKEALENFKNGNGDRKPARDGIYEMRFFKNQAYRVYYTDINGTKTILKVSRKGNDKEQTRNIDQAVKRLGELQNRRN